MSNVITVVLADDHGVLRDGLSAVLNTQPDINVVGLVANGGEAVQAVEILQPDVAIMDIMMPELTGLEAAGQIRRASPATRVLILSMHLTDNHVRSALQSGARGYLLKESAGDEVVKAVRTVAAGGRFFSPQIPTNLLKNYTDTNEGPATILDSMTEREQQVLQLLLEGHTNSEIAVRLNLSPKTVHTYRARLMDKLHVQTTVELVRLAIRYGLIEL